MREKTRLQTRLLAGAAALFLLPLLGSLALWAVPVQAATVSQLEQQQKALQNQLSRARSQYYSAAQSVSATKAQINALSYQLNQTRMAMATTSQRLNAINASEVATEALMAATQKQYNSVQSALTSATAALAATRKQLAQERYLLTAEVQFIEEHGRVSYLSVALDARSFADFVSRLYVLTQLAKEAGAMVKLVRATEKDQVREQTQLATERQALAARRNQLASEQSLLASEQAQAASLQAQQNAQATSYSQGIQHSQSLLSQLTQQQHAAEASMTYLTQQINQVTQEVNALLAKFQGGYLTRLQLYQALYPLVSPIANQFSLSPALVIAVITEESGGNEQAVSGAGAIGLMQLMPGTAASLGIDPYNAYQNVVGGCTYLHEMLGMFKGSLSLALSAYNAGPGNVDNYLATYPSAQMLPYTAGYVDNILALYQQYQTFAP